MPPCLRPFSSARTPNSSLGALMRILLFSLFWLWPLDAIADDETLPCSRHDPPSPCDSSVSVLSISPCPDSSLHIPVSSACWCGPLPNSCRSEPTLSPDRKLFGDLLTCRSWDISFLSQPVLSNKVVDIAIHIMSSSFFSADVHPFDKGNFRLDPPSPPPIADYWNTFTLRAFFDGDGLVNRIWRLSNSGIQFAVRRVDSCKYHSHLRLDNRGSAAVLNPDGYVPWAQRLYRSISDIFIRESAQSPVIHVLLWWAIGDGGIGDAPLPGYSRASGRGGPAVWIDTLKCLDRREHPGEALHELAGHCARLIAHEFGHALSLHHVRKVGEPEIRDAVDQRNNLMNSGYRKCGLTSWQIQRALGAIEKDLTHTVGRNR